MNANCEYAYNKGWPWWCVTRSTTLKALKLFAAAMVCLINALISAVDFVGKSVSHILPIVTTPSHIVCVIVTLCSQLAKHSVNKSPIRNWMFPVEWSMSFFLIVDYHMLHIFYWHLYVWAWLIIKAKWGHAHFDWFQTAILNTFVVFCITQYVSVYASCLAEFSKLSKVWTWKFRQRGNRIWLVKVWHYSSCRQQICSQNSASRIR